MRPYILDEPPVLQFCKAARPSLRSSQWHIHLWLTPTISKFIESRLVASKPKGLASQSPGLRACELPWGRVLPDSDKPCRGCVLSSTPPALCGKRSCVDVRFLVRLPHSAASSRQSARTRLGAARRSGRVARQRDGTRDRWRLIGGHARGRKPLRAIHQNAIPDDRWAEHGQSLANRGSHAEQALLRAGLTFQALDLAVFAWLA